MKIEKPYHEGELAAQQRANESEAAIVNGRVFSPAIPAGALSFIAEQPMGVVGSIDSKGRVWASVLVGEPGFLSAPDNRTLILDLSEPRSASDDPLWRNVSPQSNVGLVIIEFGSRRRLRVTGRARKVSATQYVIDVERAYPNCPKYIQRRTWREPTSDSPRGATVSSRGRKLTAAQQTLIGGADTFFVASAHPEQGIDISHRGGRPGFVDILEDDRLLIPDFAGNSMFNTLGNFISYPYAGLAFIDFPQNCLLQLTGRADILWDAADPSNETGGTRRYWQFEIFEWIECELPYRLIWDYWDASPHNPRPLDKRQAGSSLSLKVERIRQETERIKSFRLRAADGGLLPKFQAGAHLRVKVGLPGGDTADRHYSLLSNPNDLQAYEIGVLLEPEGRGGSRYLHERIQVGDIIDSSLPINEFPLANDAAHSILIAGGIGITPILSMMHQLASEQKSLEIHYTARTEADLAFRETIERIAGERAHFYSSNAAGGRRPSLERILAKPQPGAHVYGCGPRRMISALRDIASATGWPPAQIHFESFGAKVDATDTPFDVYLDKSRKKFAVPAEKTVLDVLLEAGVKVPYQCRRGECGLCVARVLGGEPEHRDVYLGPEERTGSMCLCVSRARGGSLILDL